MSFHEVVLDWLRIDDPGATEVVSVDAYGSDWAGSTDAGFYETFEVSIVYITGGMQRTMYVQGSKMESLWKHVTQG